MKDLLDFADRHFLHQLVNHPTRSDPPNTLDLLFTNSPELFHSLETIDMSGTSDHKLVNFNTDLTVEVSEDETNKLSRSGLAAFNFPRANCELLKEALALKDLAGIVHRAKDANIDGTSLSPILIGPV